MEHERQTVGDKFNEDKSTQQGRVHNEALRRLQGDAPVIGNDAPGQHEVMDSLGWANGDHLVTVERGVQPFPSAAAGVDGEHIQVEQPSRLGPLTSSPLCVESNSGRAMSSRDLFKKG